MSETNTTREIAVTKALLQEIYDTKQLRDERFSRLSQALTDLTDGEFRNAVYDSGADKLFDLTLKTLLGDELFGDWEYLLHECPTMTGGGKITVGGKEYRIQNFGDLWHYWESEGLL